MVESTSIIQLATFDFNVLNDFFKVGGGFRPGLQAKILANGPLKDIIARANADIIPPWELPPRAPDAPLLNRIFSNDSLIDRNDPLFERGDVDDNFKNLFALYNGLTRVQELTAFAQTSAADSQRVVLNRQFQRLAEEAEGFVNASRFRDMSLIFGVKTDTLESTVLTPRTSNSTVIFGGTASTVRGDPIPGLTGTETFTIAVTRGGTTTNVNIDLSAVAGTLNVDNLATFINGELLAAGFTTAFQAERFNESSFGFRINVASGEDISFSADAASESAAIYVAGNSGSGTLGSAFVTKIDDLSAADPNQVFRENIDSTAALDRGNAVAVDSKGNVIVVGTTAGDLDGQISNDGNDVFLTKFDHAGNEIFTRLLGSSDQAAGFAVAVDSSDNIIVAGQVFGQLTSSGFGGNYDTFVTKFDESGQETFTRQAAPFANDGAFGLTVGSSDEIFVTGFTNAAVASNLTHGGGTDGFVTKLTSAGTLVYNKQFGGTGNEVATAITLSGAGDVLVAGTADGNGFLRKFTDTATNDPPVFNVDLGSLGSGGDITGVATNSLGEIFVSGVTTNTALDDTVVQAHSGALDGFVMRITDAQITTGSPLAIADSVPITINAVNDPPTIANPGAQIVAQDTDLTVNGLSIADVDVAAGNLEVTVAVTNGSITLAQTTGLAFSVGSGTGDTTATFQGSLADINAALSGLTYRGNGGFSGPDTFSVTVSDLGNTGSGGAQIANDSFGIEVGDVNSAPVITVPGTQALPFFADLTIAGISIADSDVAADNLEATLTATGGTLTLSQTTGLAFSTGDGTADATMTFQGTLTDINAAINDLIYSSSNFFGGDANTVTINVSDLGNNGAGGTLTDNATITIVDVVNAAPVLTVPGAQAAIEDTALAVSGVSIADTDAASGSIEVTLGVGNGTLDLGQITGLTFTTGDGTSDASMTFQGTLADVNAALAGLSYLGDANFNGAETLSINVSDLANTGAFGGTGVDSDTVAITVAAANDAPQIANPGPQQIVENASLTVTGLSISDADAGAASVEATLSVASGTFSLGQTTGLTFSTGDGAADASMVFQGTLTDINAALAALVYTPTTGFSGQDTLSVSIDDLGNSGGAAQVTSDGVLISVVDATNTAPTVTNPGAQNVDEDTDLTITGLSIGDIDAGSGNLEVTLSVTDGLLTLADTTGLTFTTGDGTQDSTLTFRGNLDDINAAIDGLIYRGNLNFNGSDTLQINVNDLGNSVSNLSGGTTPAIDYVSYIGTSANDRASGLAIDPATDDIYVTGSTAGLFAGEVANSTVDAYATKLTRAGATVWTHQFGGAFTNAGTAIAFDSNGTSVLSRLGLPDGPGAGLSATSVTGETAVRGGQSFSISVNGAEPRQVTIDDDDSFGFLVFRINQILESAGRAEIVETFDGERLEINALNGSIVELLRGPDNFDALSGLGLKPIRLFGDPTDIIAAEAFSASAFALGFFDTLNVLTREAAADANIIVENAQRVIREAFRFLTEGPEPPPPPTGSASAQTLKELANYEDAARRLQQPVSTAAVLGIF